MAQLVITADQPFLDSSANAEISTPPSRSAAAARILRHASLEKQIRPVDEPSSPCIGHVRTVGRAAEETGGATSSTFARRVRNE